MLVAATMMVSAHPAQAASHVPVLRQGDRGSEVATWQATVNLMIRLAAADHGRYLPLAVDAVFGPLTERATRRFQRLFRIPVTGVVGSRSWKAEIGALVTPSCAYAGGLSPPPLRAGDQSPCVGWWQLVLNRWMAKHEPARPRLIPDGVFGPLTEAATLAFQDARRIAMDGLVGPRTWRTAGRLGHFP